MKFGWCQGSGHHDSCRKETGTTAGILRCGCACHDGDSPSGEGESGSGKRRESGVAHERMDESEGRSAVTESDPLATISTQPKGA